MIVLGVDPSFTATGYAVIEQQGKKQVLLRCGFLPLPTKLQTHERVGIFFEFFTKLISELSVTHVALETPFLGKNAQTFLKLGYLRGALHVLAYQFKLTLVEVSPREVKAAVTGYGGAPKDQVARMIYNLFPGLKIQKTYDVTDAIAVGLCGLWYKPPIQQLT